MLLYIAEKPSTMILVKKAYERSNKPCGDITFVALAGHVCGLMEPKEYSQWNLKWKDLKLPMVPDSFRIKSIKPDLVKKIRDLIKSGITKASSSAPTVMWRGTGSMPFWKRTCIWKR